MTRFRVRRRQTAAAVFAATTALSLWSASPAAGQQCGERDAAFSAAFEGLPKDLSVAPVCPADAGPGFADPKPTAQFSTITAGEVTDTLSSPERTILAVVVATVENDDGQAFIDGL